MNTPELKRFTQPEVLYEIGTELLDELLSRFKTDLDHRKVVIPNPNLADGHYYESVAELFKAPAALPAQLVDAVQAVEELASPENKSRLEAAFSDSPLELYIEPQASPEHTALKIWLNAPDARAQAADPGPSLSPPEEFPAGERAKEETTSVPLAVEAESESSPPVAEKRQAVEVQAKDCNPEKDQSEHSATYTHRRTGKIACLPKETREQINEMLNDGLTYRAIIKELGKEGEGLNEVNMTNWNKGGYQDWLAEQKDKEEATLWEEYALDLVKQSAFPSLNEATIKMATLNIRKAIRAIGHAGLETSVTDKPENYIRLLNALARLTTGAITCQNERTKAEQRQAEAEQRKADPDSLCVTAETLQKIEKLLRLR